MTRSKLTVDVQGVGLDVGLICQGWAPDGGGVESHTQDLARALARRGHRAHVLCLDYSGEHEPYSVHTSEHEGVEVRRMAYQYHDHGALADVVYNRKTIDVVMAWMAETPCDVIHVHHLTGFGLGVLRAIMDLGQPLVMTLHDYWPFDPRGQLLHTDGHVSNAADAQRTAASLAATWTHLMPSGTGRAEGPKGEALGDDVAAVEAMHAYARECLGHANALLTPSAAAREVYVRSGIPADSLQVLENGIEVDELGDEVRALRAGRSADPDDLHLGVLGSVLPSKGVLELARAFTAAALPNLTLHVHGALPPYHGDSSYVDALQELAGEHARLVVHGPYERAGLAAILAGLDGVAAPSRWEEVYGLTVREARAAGLPVLVSDAGDLPSVTANGSAGLVVPRDDADAWMAALARFASDAEARATWSGAAAPVRDSMQMMHELERVYVETILKVTGRMPELEYLPEGMTDPAAVPAQGAKAAKRGLLGRLFGR